MQETQLQPNEEQVFEPIINPNEPQNPILSYNLDNLSTDCISARIIAPAYATHSGELNAILTYIYLALQFEYQGREDIAKKLHKISMDEMRHFNLLGQTLIRLGANPVFTSIPPIRANYYNTREICYTSNFVNMIRCAIQGESRAIREYKSMLNRLDNLEVKNIINYIIPQEEEHLVILNEILSSL